MSKTINDWFTSIQQATEPSTADPVITYLIAQGLTLTPFIDKHPFLKGWKEYDYQSLDKTYYANVMTNWLLTDNSQHAHNIGLLLKKSDNLLCVDFDPGHTQVDGYQKTIELAKALNWKKDTLYLTKPNSFNKHIFYRNQANLDIRKTTGWFHDSDIFTHNQSVSVINPYQFANLDLSRPFADQLADTPTSVIDYANKLDNQLNNPTDINLLVNGLRVDANPDTVDEPDKVISYLLDQGLSLIPEQNKKPLFKGFMDYDYQSLDNNQYAKILTAWLSTTLTNAVHDIAIVLKPQDNILCVDFDPEHTKTTSKQTLAKSLFKELKWDSNQTVYLKRAGSINKHFLYKNNHNYNYRMTTGDFCASDLLTSRQAIRIINTYQFANLDLTKPLVDQLADTPQSIVDYIDNDLHSQQVKRERAQAYRDAHPIKLLKSDKAQDTAFVNHLKRMYNLQRKFTVGSRHKDLLTAALWAANNGISYNSARLVLDIFAHEVVYPVDCDENIDKIVDSAYQYTNRAPRKPRKVVN